MNGPLGSSRNRKFQTVLFFVLVTFLALSAKTPAGDTKESKDSKIAPNKILGFRDASAESTVEEQFLRVPDPKLAEEHLRTLTQAPHIAGSPEDKATADYVARKFREAGFETEEVEYRVWMIRARSAWT